MKQEVKEFAVEKAKEMMNAFSCSPEAKAAAESWLAALGTEAEQAETEKFLAELEADVLPVEACVAFTASEAGIQLFGAEKAKQMHAHSLELQKSGAVYCDCPACTAGGLIAIWPFWAIVGRILMMVLLTRNCWLTPLLYLKKFETMGKTTLFGIPEWPMLFL